MYEIERIDDVDITSSTRTLVMCIIVDVKSLIPGIISRKLEVQYFAVLAKSYENR